ncbi:hypothetical protein [Catenuloplanes indicus]|uniref:Uncharacterized protein n=1 Tax=Catenuloplanes indicus TaxID=137267 RepID=A0AAE3VTH4_9ACTN|nr:hypothetical protein [Catenuloplanes indicus]MDQ0363401.1 hypothetical protein [Catenuloplanes indicus]
MTGGKEVGAAAGLARPRQPLDVDQLPPTQALLLEVLAARYRLGEHLWTFPSSCTSAARGLSGRGLIGWKGGVAPRTIQAWLTDAGRQVCLLDGYEPAPVKAAREAERKRIAYRIRAELVCCDIYDRDHGTNRAGRTHPICFWGEAGAQIAEDPSGPDEVAP